MKRTTRQLQQHSLRELLQEVERRIKTEPLQLQQQQGTIELLMSLLQACGHAIEYPAPGLDMRDIRGQWHVKRALEVAAAGGHNILLVGPAGAGKVQLARSLRSLLPKASLSHSMRELPPHMGKDTLVEEPTMHEALTLAHGGVLLLKDIDTFHPSLLTQIVAMFETQMASLPLQDVPVLQPTQFLLVATVKPCPCGFADIGEKPCPCPEQVIAQYREGIKEMVRRCFALEIEVPKRQQETLREYTEEDSATIQGRVKVAREIQRQRYARTTHLSVNADLREASEVQHYCQMYGPEDELIKTAIRQLHLTSLEVLRLQAVARTVADLDDSSTIAGKHLAEAIRYVPTLTP